MAHHDVPQAAVMNDPFVTDARREGRRIVRDGLAPYMKSIGLEMPPPGRIIVPRDEVSAVLNRGFEGMKVVLARQNRSIQHMATAFVMLSRFIERTQMSKQTEDFNDARTIGMNPAQAARWAKYREQMGSAGIGLDEAYLQIKAAEDRAAMPHPRPPKHTNSEA